jgi:hypothetical protein
MIESWPIPGFDTQERSRKKPAGHTEPGKISLNYSLYRIVGSAYSAVQ